MLILHRSYAVFQVTQENAAGSVRRAVHCQASQAVSETKAAQPEILSYLEGWRDALAKFARMGERVFVSLFVPPDPIGFVKSFDELREALRAAGTIEHEVLVDGDQLMAVVRAARWAPRR